MLKLSSLCIAAVLALQAPCSVAQEAPMSAAAEQALAAQIDASISRHYKADAPGATVIVTRDGKTVFHKAYGMASVAKKQAMTPDMTLRIGSITKQFTAVAILMLVEEGKLALSDDITKFLPDYPTKGKKITVEQLLTHTSGIVSYTGKMDFAANNTKDLTVQQMIDTFKNDPLTFEPGTNFAYNNSGYFLLGAVIEKVSGMPYAKFLEKRIFVPLGMNDTAYEGYERSAATKAEGHSKKEAAYTPSAPLSMSLPYAAGSLVSNVDDLARWEAAITGGKLINAASLAKAFTPFKLSDGSARDYGYGWQIGKLQGNQTIGHGGGINGFVSYALRIPQSKVFVAVLSNADSGIAAPEMVAQKAGAIAMGKAFPEYKAIKLNAKALDAFAGVYAIDDKSKRMIWRENDQLVMQRTGRGITPLLAHSANGFFLEDSLVHMEFVRDASGAVTKVTVHQNGAADDNVRTAEALPVRTAVKVAHAVLDTYVGRYELAPGFIMTITRNGDRFGAQATGQPGFELHALSDTLFFPKEVDAKVRFEKNAEGKISQLVLLQGGREMPGKRLP
ncbi:serine hydrolase [Massilia glaciei]|uniref:Serine hydrolase n=1 Tax=Massilia glaciei TaxID=1524097 RepID=A0A2U2I718_9BURK|nr:serine hydrolase [Massilia glaciei]PWF55558.1 serine hydrolase [Massilia glaciei]